MRGALKKVLYNLQHQNFHKNSLFFTNNGILSKVRILGYKQNKMHQNCAKQQKHNSNVTNQSKKHREGKLSKSRIIAYLASFE